MSEPLGQIEGPLVVRRELHRHMAKVGRALGAQIHGHVQYGAACRSNQLGLRVRRELEVHAAYRPFPDAPAHVHLLDYGIEAVVLELPPAKGPREITPAVHPALEVHHEDPTEDRLLK